VSAAIGQEFCVNHDMPAAVDAVLANENLFQLVWMAIGACPQAQTLLQGNIPPEVIANAQLQAQGDVQVPPASQPPPPMEFAAVAAGDVATVERIITQDPEAPRRRHNGMNLLHSAALLGQEPIVRMLLHRRESLAGDAVEGTIFDIESRGIGNRSSALHLAAWHGHTTTVKILLEHRAEPNGRMLSGDTALHQAAFNDHAEVVRALLEAKASLPAVKEDGNGALHLAAAKGHLGMVALLLEAGEAAHRAAGGAVGTPCELVRFTNTQALTPAHLAVVTNHPAVAELLITRGHHDVNSGMQGGDTVLHFAAKLGYLALVQTALAAGGDVNALLTPGRESPLHLACASGQIEVFQP
jgi:ankyrin repeat protein